MRPRIGITLGDCAGIGPEIAAKAAADARVLQVCEPVIYGPPSGSTATTPQPTGIPVAVCPPSE